jgi:uncharacterized repeat protein (TIGR03803 family)
MKSNYGQGKYSGMAAMLLIVLAVVVMFAGAAVPAQAQTPTTLYNFVNGSSDAASPAGNIVQGRDGNMYGVGAILGRGANNTGAVYKISPAGAESVFFNFPATISRCYSGLTLGSDGNFYGTCGTNTATGTGILYRLTPAGVFTDIHDFTASDDPVTFQPIQASDGNLYGVTPAIVYKRTPAGVFTTIHTFVSPDVQPLSNLFQASDGNLYATITLCALSGNRGCVYKVSTRGTYKNIYGFADPTGSIPCTGVVQGKDGKLYGATGFGRPLNDGNIYKVTTAGVNTGLHDFDSVTEGACNPGAFPVVSLLQVTDGTFYGTNYGGGDANNGSIYKLTSANVFSVFLFPSSNIDGGQPYSTLLQNTNGLVYGTTSGGGANSVGNFFTVATGDAPFVNLEPTQKTGYVGASVGMFGQGFDSTSVVKFGGVAATSVTLSGSTYLTAKVPVGAHTGTVTVTTGSTTLTSPQTFKVKPKITTFSPPSGSTGTLVTINGTGLIQATAVKFGTVKATTFTVVSDSEVTADVPSGLAPGMVTISITTPGGTANSPTKFTVN